MPDSWNESSRVTFCSSGCPYLKVYGYQWHCDLFKQDLYGLLCEGAHKLKKCYR